ncbi:MAG: hypothetical protein ACI4LN_05035 [Anaerovoracaceae bacterium]
MKKLIIFLLILTLILTSTIAVFANTNKQNVGKICLDISTSNKDVEYVKKHMNKVNGKPHTWSKKSAAFAGGEY